MDDDVTPPDDELFRRWRETGSRAVRNELVERHRGLAYHLAERYAEKGVDRDDLRQIAVVGLVKAVERFDPDHGTAFATFARPYITGELKHHFRDATWSVGVPRGLKELHGKIRRARPVLTQRLTRPPTVEEIAQHLGEDVDDVLEALDAGAAHRTRPVDHAPGAEDDTMIAGEVPKESERGFGHVERSLLVRDLLDQLPDRERRILELRFYEEMTQREIAEEIGISQMHVSRLIRRTLAELQEELD